MWFLLSLSLLHASEYTVKAEVIKCTEKSLTFNYRNDRGSIQKATVTITPKTEFLRDDKAIEHYKIPAWTRVEIVFTKKRVALRIVLPPSPAKDHRASDEDQQVMVEGDIVKVDREKKEVGVEKRNGKKLTFQWTGETAVSLDGIKKDTSSLKKGQIVRIWVWKVSRKLTHVYIFEVTERD